MNICIYIVLVTIMSMPLSCHAEQPKYSGGPYYFTGWKNYKIPFEPVGQIPFEKAKQLTAYYEAYFDKNGNIVSFKKYINGKIEWSDAYSYDKSGTILNRILTRNDGTVIKQYFDEKGRIIK
jgi:antitoxin component YwqK of YwqJK toxin-antitoxin module